MGFCRQLIAELARSINKFSIFLFWILKQTEPHQFTRHLVSSCFVRITCPKLASSHAFKPNVSLFGSPSCLFLKQIGSCWAYSTNRVDGFELKFDLCFFFLSNGGKYLFLQQGTLFSLYFSSFFVTLFQYRLSFGF